MNADFEATNKFALCKYTNTESLSFGMGIPLSTAICVPKCHVSSARPLYKLLHLPGTLCADPNDAFAHSRCTINICPVHLTSFQIRTPNICHLKMLFTFH